MQYEQIALKTAGSKTENVLVIGQQEQFQKQREIWSKNINMGQGEPIFGNKF